MENDIHMQFHEIFRFFQMLLEHTERWELQNGTAPTATSVFLRKRAIKGYCTDIYLFVLRKGSVL